MSSSTIHRPMTGSMILLIILITMSTGCEEKEKGIEITPDTPYSIDFKANKGDTLYFKWSASGDLTWQLLDNNATRVPRIPEHIFGCGVSGEEDHKLFQNATYTLHFASTNEKTISLYLEWELR